MRNYVQSLDPRLPRNVYVLQAGGLVNAFGNGVVIPFMIIYLHNVRGIPLGLAGLAAAVQSAAALGSGFLAGTYSDRIGARRVLFAALTVSTVAFALMPRIRSAWEAFAIYIVWGIGSGAFWPAQSTLLAGLTPPERRSPAYALQRLTMNLGVALGGVVAGLIATVGHPGSFEVLFAINCATFLAYMLVLTRVRAPELHPARHEGRWREVAHDRVFVAYTLLNAAFMTVAISISVELLPAFAKNTAHVNERQVGLIFALVSVGIVVFQLPVAKALQGHSRMKGLAVMGVIWAASLLLVFVAGTWSVATTAALILCVSSLVFAIGECLHGAIHAPLSVDLAPPHLLGRYVALASLSWQVGWIIGPAGGGFVLQHRPLLLWPLAAAANLLCSAWALALERKLPERVRITPLEATSSG